MEKFENSRRRFLKGAGLPMEAISGKPVPAMFHLKQAKRYRVRMRTASDDIHPVHLHRHSFELTKIAGTSTAGVLKDVVMLGGYQTYEINFVADNPASPFSTAISNSIWISASWPYSIIFRFL
jgi:FtsP/CotA-like multicopper oxidase with cupredoxin domain